MKVTVRMDRGCRFCHCQSRWPPVGSDNSDLLLLLAAEAKLGRSEQTVCNQDIPVDAIVSQLRLSYLAHDKHQRLFALSHPPTNRYHTYTTSTSRHYTPPC